MITAAEAKEKTKERLKVIAKEFIINNTRVPIQRAIDVGQFYTTVGLERVHSPKEVGPEVVKLLQEQGFKAQVCYGGIDSHDAYILIKWED